MNHSIFKACNNNPLPRSSLYTLWGNYEIVLHHFPPKECKEQEK
uniref:Macaca fascicularis brain cDNA, clone: QflA-17251 n=1 Tax=Macaca fascicularis TaxID=9541 RepID=I7GBR9_MACFA|nr:unnamed protein product [Macaca fascicularis]